MSWPDDDELRRLWAEGLSTAKIGRELGTTKNAVVGRAHRLDLTPRPSPVKRDRPMSTPKPKPPVAPKLTELLPRTPTVTVATATPEPPAPQRPGVTFAAPAGPIGPRGECCWSLGEPGTPSFRYCEVVFHGRRPYCAEHASIGYVKVRDRREDAA